jgi:hypothetical protein
MLMPALFLSSFSRLHPAAHGRIVQNGIKVNFMKTHAFDTLSLKEYLSHLPQRISLQVLKVSEMRLVGLITSLPLNVGEMFTASKQDPSQSSKSTVNNKVLRYVAQNPVIVLNVYHFSEQFYRSRSAL